MTETVEAYNVPRGAAYFTSQQVVSYLVSFLFYITLARLLSLDKVGQISLLAATLAIFNTVTQLALPATATRYISNNLGRGQPETAGAVVRTTLRLSLLIGLVGLAVAVPLSPYLGPRILGTEAFTVMTATFLAGMVLDLTAMYGAYFLGTGLYAHATVQNFLYVPLSRGLGLALAAMGFGVLGIVIGWAAGGITALLVSVYMWSSRLPSTSHHPIRPLLAFTLPLFVSTIISLGQQWGDIALLQTLLGRLATTGTYYIVVSSVGFLSILWIPVSSALYPALSAYHSTNDTQGITDRLRTASRLTTLAVLPLSVSLAAVSSTALEIAYRPEYAEQSTAFAILTLTSILTAQAAILTATLQAVGKTHALLRITLVATIIDLATVALTALLLGPVAGAIGRALLYTTSVALARRSLRPVAHVQSFTGLRQATVLALGTGFPLLATDQGLTWVLGLTALLRLPILLAVFAVSFLSVSRKARVFKPQDFAILKDALPRRLHPYLRTVEHLIIGRPSAAP